MGGNKEGGKQDDKAKKRAANERSITIIMILLIIGFVISWTPYAGVAFYAAFLGEDLPPIWGTLPAMFSKSSMVWTSIIYIFLHPGLAIPSSSPCHAYIFSISKYTWINFNS